MIVRHITEIDRLESIQNQGLTAWTARATTRESVTGETLYDGEGIWVWGDGETGEAEGFATDNYNDGWVVLTVDVSGLGYLSDAEYPDGVAYIVTEDIPADRIISLEIIER